MKLKGFTLIEVIFCISIILVMMMLVIPNITSKNNTIKDKTCGAQLEVINSVILFYEIDNGELPLSIEDLYNGHKTYIKEEQALCPNGKQIYIEDGQAYVEN